MLRNVLALLAGILAMFLVTWGLEALGHIAFPLPSGLDPRDPAQAQAFARYLATMPLGAQAALVLAWSGGAFAGGFVAPVSRAIRAAWRWRWGRWWSPA